MNKIFHSKKPQGKYVCGRSILEISYSSKFFSFPKIISNPLEYVDNDNLRMCLYCFMNTFIKYHILDGSFPINSKKNKKRIRIKYFRIICKDNLDNIKRIPKVKLKTE